MKVYEGAILYLEYRLKRLYKTAITSNYKEYKKSYLLGFLNGLNQRFQDQRETSEEFFLAVQVPAEVLNEWKKRFGELKDRVMKPTIYNVDFEAYVEGQNHAKETKLMSEELLQI